MEIMDFINSKDVRDYLREIHYQFTAAEAAFIVYSSKRATFEEKAGAWQDIIADMPDCAVPERLNCMQIDSIHQFLTDYIELQKKGIDRFCQQENSVYGYECHAERKENSFPDVDGWYGCRTAFFSTYSSCIEYCKKYKLDRDDEIDKICIYKYQLDPSDDRRRIADQILLNRELEILDTEFYYLEDEREREIDLAFDGMCFNFPTPFRRGDILVDCSDWRYCPFVLSYIPTWSSGELKARGFAESDCPNRYGWKDYDRRVTERILKMGDISNMSAIGTIIGGDGKLYLENCFAIPLDLEYFRGTLAGMERQLKVFSEFEKNKIDGELLANCCYAIRTEEYAKQQVEKGVSGYLEDYMEQVGMIPAVKEQRGARTILFPIRRPL